MNAAGWRRLAVDGAQVGAELREFFMHESFSALSSASMSVWASEKLHICVPHVHKNPLIKP